MAKTLTAINNHDGTYSWTLTSILGDALNKAEQKFGNRDMDYTILGIEFVDHSNPHTWHIGTGNKHILIRLTLSSIDDFNQGVFQLAHEVIHCLSPEKDLKVTVLEEGLATLFSIEYSKNHGGLICNDKNYLDACNLVEQLLKIDNDIIKNLRKIQPKISLITKEDIIKMNSSVPLQLAQDLTQLF